MLLSKDETCTCGHPPNPKYQDGKLINLGYGVDADGNSFCYDCCDAKDREKMETHGGITLLLAGDFLTNKTGGLRFPIINKKYGRHNISGQRVDLWFNGPCKMLWQGVTYGKSDKVTAQRCLGIRHLMEQLGPRGIAISLKDGEYRVNYKHGKEATAYYTEDAVDAFHTALQMIEDKKKRDAEPQPITL